MTQAQLDFHNMTPRIKQEHPDIQNQQKCTLRISLQNLSVMILLSSFLILKILPINPNMIRWNINLYLQKFKKLHLQTL